MATTYAGDPANYPEEITIPSDGDAPDVASVNAALEGLADRTAAIQTIRVDEWISADGTWECPIGVTKVIVEGCGGGGGGGCGGSGAAGGGGASGAGGGGAVWHRQTVAVTPGVVYTVARGSVGGSVLGSPWALGGGFDGGDTTFSSPGPVVLTTFRGAMGGNGDVDFGDTGRYISGGQPVRGAAAGPWITSLANITVTTGIEGSTRPKAQEGGWGSHPTATSPSSEWTTGGSSATVAGAAAGAANTARGGGGGGASGAPGCAPGAGGAGGTASAAGSNGTDGTRGAGGGGGGGGGSGATTSGGLGGTGGAGMLRVIYIGPQAVVT